MDEEWAGGGPPLGASPRAPALARGRNISRERTLASSLLASSPPHSNNHIFTLIWVLRKYLNGAADLSNFIKPVGRSNSVNNDFP